jgi:hypothetical protein
MFEGARAVCYVRQLWLDLNGYDPDLTYEVQTLVDNTSAIAIGDKPKDTAALRHIRRKYHFVRQERKEGQIGAYWIPTDLQLADVMTKPVTSTTLAYNYMRAVTEVVTPLEGLPHIPNFDRDVLPLVMSERTYLKEGCGATDSAMDAKPVATQVRHVLRHTSNEVEDPHVLESQPSMRNRKRVRWASPLVMGD